MHSTRYQRTTYLACAPIYKANMWAKAKTGSKLGFDKLYGLVDKLGPPVNKLSNKVGAEAFWPTTLDKESDKAARILRSFCSTFNGTFCATKAD